MGSESIDAKPYGDAIRRVKTVFDIGVMLMEHLLKSGDTRRQGKGQLSALQYAV